MMEKEEHEDPASTSDTKEGVDLHRKLFFEGSSDGMLLASTGGNILDANAEACRILQRPKEELTGAGSDEIFDTSDPRLESAREERRRAGRFEGELRLLRGDGTFFPAEVSIVVHRDGAGIAFRDVTGRVGSGPAPLESEEFFRTLVENMLDVVVISDADATTLYWSPSVERVLGYRPEELVGTKVADLVHPEDLERTMEEKDGVIGGSGAFGLGEHRLRHKNGSYRHLQSHINNLLDDPRVRGVIIGVRDVTELRRAEEEIRQLNETLERRVEERTAQLLAAMEETDDAEEMLREGLKRLRESEEQFRTTFDQAAIGIAHVAPDGWFLRVNQKLCEITGYSREELLERTFRDITHSDDLAKDLNHLYRMLSGEISTYSTEKRYVKKDYSRIWVSLTVSLVRKPSGDPDYFISVVEDITGRKEAELFLRSLTPREIETLRLLAWGRTNREIAQEMMFSVSTVKSHVRHIIAKLGVSDRTQAAVRATELGLLPPSDRGP